MKFDRLIRWVFVPLVGLAIPNLTGLYGSLTPSSVLYWIGSVWFILVSVAVWRGNLALWLRWRKSPEWLRNPARRTMMLLSSSLFYTAPVSVLMLWAWYVATSQPADWTVILKSALACVFVDLFIKNTYESVYLIRHQTTIERARLQAELAALRSQVDPHFVFNCLNTLAALTHDHSDRATGFTVAMADVYRYLLRIKDRDLVPLDEELGFVRQYYSLLSVRYDKSIDLSIVESDSASRDRRIPPAALQTLVENAVKHNRFSSDQPLVITVEVGPGSVTVANSYRPASKGSATGSSGVGLENLSERCLLLLGKRIEIAADAAQATFRVTVPLGEPEEGAKQDRSVFAA